MGNLIKESGRTARITLTKSHDSGHMTQSASQMTRVDHPVARNPSSSLEDEIEKCGVIKLVKDFPGLGFSLDDSSSGVRVRSLTPNGPASRDGRLQTDDRILSVN